jgi:glycerol kinase
MGLTQYTTKAHIVRAALDGICYQTREVKRHFPLSLTTFSFATRLSMRCMTIVVCDFRN